jgi:ribosomal protein S18 acetylase RimI-like enzyme
MGSGRDPMIVINELLPDQYRGHLILVRYVTDEYIDVISLPDRIEFKHKRFFAPQAKSFDARLFEPWLEQPIAFGAFADDRLVGVIEGSLETWNQRFRITNLWIDESLRRQGIAKQLMRTLIDEAIKRNRPRALILETQSCNVAAIALYQSFGFDLIGLDTMCYGNNDIEQHEVRLEWGKRIQY